MHAQAYDFVARSVAGRCAQRVLEIGSHDVNGSVRPLFGSAERYHGIDLAAGPGVDEVADAADWEPDDVYDVVISTEVLEHAPRWRRVLATAWRALAPGGRLVVTCATDPRPPHSAVDGWALRPGEWYRNVAPGEVREVIGGFGAWSWAMEVALDRGDLYLRVDKPR